MDNTTLSLVTAALSGLPPCGLTCIQKLPEWVEPLTIDALNGVCKNIQADVTQFGTCVTATCTNTTQLNSAITVVGLVPTGCSSLGFNTTGVVVPKIVIPSASAVTSTTTKSESNQLQAFGIIASAVAIAALLF
ncbi:UNVERIFIED_CONTAM: hypothetical protein HDU68_006660 [Siphonaria sp. JEL0065]|nr:hypothetical protein HDU68_006660 [Siphonaria sp. JEL0065]